MIVVYMHTLRGTLMQRFPGFSEEYVKQWHKLRVESGTFQKLGVYRVDYEVVRQ